MDAQPERNEVGFSAGWASCQCDVLNTIEVEIESLQKLKESGQEVPWDNIDDFLNGIRYVMTLVEHLRE